MNCDDVKRKLVDLLYGESTPELQQSVHEHLAGCDTCRAEWDALRRTHALLNDLPSVEKPPMASAAFRRDDTASSVNVAGVFGTVAERTERSRRRWRLGAVAGGLTAAALLLFVGLEVRVELFPGHMVIAWKDVPQEPAAVQFKTDELDDRLNAQAERIAGVEELAGLAAREVLAVDRRHSDELAELRQQLTEITRLRRQLVALERQTDERWRLLANAVLHRDAALAVLSRNRNIPVTEQPLTEQGVQP